MTDIKAVYIVAQTRVMDGFWYANDQNKCFLSKDEALAYCKTKNEERLAKMNAKLKNDAITRERDNQRLRAVMDKLTKDEQEVLMYDFGVDYYTDTEFKPLERFGYELSVIEFKVE